MNRLFILIALVLASCTQPAFAQAWTTSERSVSYPVDNPESVVPQIGDGTNASGGTPPALTYEPADIPTTVSQSGWTTTSGVVAPTGTQAKFRTTLNVSHVATVDPIRGLGKKPYGHCHTFFGNMGTNERSDYTSLRSAQTAMSSAGGGPLNLTAYWFPCVMKANALGDGITRVKKPNYIIVYYVVEYAEVTRNVRLPRGLRYILGTNMDDPNEVSWKAEIAAANAAAVTGGGAGGWAYNAIGGSESNGWHGWVCEASGERKRFLTNADGSSSFVASAGAGGSCPSSSKIYAELGAPQCWDGNNLASPTGYKHFRGFIRQTGSGRSNICPTGFWFVPRLEMKIFFSHQGAEDYTKWFCASDEAAATAAGDSTYSTQHCKSMHTDWFGAWDYPTMTQWMENCNGVNGVTGHECDYSSINTTTRLITDSNSPDGSRNPQVNLGHDFTGASASDWLTLPAESAAKTKLRFRRH